MGQVNCSSGPLRIAGILIGVLAGFAAPPEGQAAGPPSEYQVKAAFLLNFTKFVEWLPAAFEDSRSPLAICVLGDDPFDGALDQLLEGEVVDGRQLVARRIRRPPEPKACQVLFISRSEKDVPVIIQGLGPGVLTVSDRDGFLGEGGVIGFVVQGRHVRFDISQRAASGAQLTLSARLLSVARSVEK